jgi:DNA-nicking Smr family endonuclease
MAKQPDADQDASAEALTFRTAMKGVKPLAQSATRVATAGRKPRKSVRAVAAAASLDLEAEMPLIDGSVAADLAAEDALSYRRPGVRDQVLRRLRRGLFPVEDELDLHGVNQARARALLAEFIGLSGQAGLRCVRIIHGKGTRSGARGAVLKSAVNTWLRRHPDVMAFTSARPIDGGTGAAYVLLRA